MKTLEPAKSVAEISAAGEHFQLVIFERVVTRPARYPDEEDVSEVFPRIYVIMTRELLRLAIEAARHAGKAFIATVATPVNVDIIAPVHGVKLG